MPPNPAEPAVVTGRDGRVGRILLNRPRTLNALDAAMLATIAAALRGWRNDPRVHAVVIEGAGGRAFCAGGDIRAVRAAVLAGEHEAVHRFFADEYATVQAIAEYPKPYVALVDGVCMGGGMGVSVHGAARAVTENALLAMPECGIGLFPDVGASFFLPRLPGSLGMFLGLTGTRLSGADAVHAGLGTHFVRRERLPALSAALARDGVAALAAFAEPLPPFTLAPRREAIDRCFSAASVRGVLDRLEAENTDWAREVLATLRANSPSSVAWSFALIRAGADRTLPACLAAELALTAHATRHPDLPEGVRAMVVDKDRRPRWSPARLEEVDADAVAALVG